MPFTTQNPLALFIADIFRPHVFQQTGQLSSVIFQFVREAEEDPDTIRGSLFVVAVSNGLFPDVATEILDRMFIEHPALQNLQSRGVDGYPEPMYCVMWYALCASAQRFFDAKAPHHIARTIFEPRLPVHSV